MRLRVPRLQSLGWSRRAHLTAASRFVIRISLFVIRAFVIRSPPCPLPLLVRRCINCGRYVLSGEAGVDSTLARITRRRMLQVGSLGLTGVSLPALLRADSARGTSGARSRADSCILVFLDGGPSHLD